MLEGALDGIRELKDLPVMKIVVSNQAGIALGLFSTGDMIAFNWALRKRIWEAGGELDAFYYCPDLEPKHLPPGARPSQCAKPAPGMLLEAKRDFDIDLGKSYMIGDKESDIIAGRSVGCTTILIKTGTAANESANVTSDFVVNSLKDASRIVRQCLAARAAAAQCDL